MLHNRFYRNWDQPTSIFSADNPYITTLKIRIAKNGVISNVKIVKSSGNVVMDESVMAAAQRVANVDPLPPGLGGSFYEVNINFALE